MNNCRKTAAVLLALIMLVGILSGCSKTAEDPVRSSETEPFIQPTFTDTPQSVKKTEIIYVNMDGNGTFTSATVSDWLHTDRPNVKVSDSTNLTDIVNVKSDIEPVYGENGALEWNMDTTDLYYSGKTTQQPPVSIRVQYFMDGTEYSAADIAGKAGTISIKISMQNNKTATIKNSKTGEDMFTVSLPILVAGGAIFPSDDFSSVSAEGATCIGDGSKQLAIDLGLPGFSSSLGLDTMEFGELNGLKMTGDCTITVTTDSFSLGNMYFVMFPLCSMDLGLVIPESLSTLTSDFDSLSSMVNVITSLDFDALSDVISGLAGNVDQLMDMADLLTQAVNAYEKNKILIEFLQKYMTEDNLAVLTTLSNSVTPDTLDTLTNLASNPIVAALMGQDLINSLNALSAAAPILKEMLNEMSQPELQQAMNDLPQTMDTLHSMSETLSENEDTLNALGKIVNSGGLDSISGLMNSLEGTDLSQLIDRYEQLLGNADGLSEKAKYWVQYGEQCPIFTSAAEGCDTSYTFICKTDSVG